MTLGLGRASLVRIPTDDRVPPPAGAARGRDRGGSRRRPSADRDRRDARDDVVDLGRPGRRHRRHRGARGSLAPRRRGVRRRGRDRSGAPRPVRRLGTGRLDRRQPAQVAVHAARRVALPDPPAGPGAERVHARARVPPDDRPLGPDARLQRVHAAARPPVPRAEALDAAPLVRAGGPPAADPQPRRAGPGVRRPGRRDARTGSGWRRSRSRRSASATCPPALAGDEDALERHNAAVMEAVNRTGEVFLSHTKLNGRFAIRLSVGNLRTEARHVERAWELLQAAATEVDA